MPGMIDNMRIAAEMRQAADTEQISNTQTAPAKPTAEPSADAEKQRKHEELVAMASQIDLLPLIQEDTGEIGNPYGDRIDFNKCPVCGHRDCFRYYPTTNTWACFSASNGDCKPGSKAAGGGMLDYLEHARGMNPTERARFVRDATGHPYTAGTEIVHPINDAAISPAIVKAYLNPDVSDKSLSRAFMLKHRDVLCYVPEQGQFFYYGGERWEPEEQEAMPCRLMKAFTDELYSLSAQIKNEADQMKFRQKLSKYSAFNQRNNAINDSKSEAIVHMSEFDTSADLLNVKNGTLDLKTFELYPHRPADMITKVCNAEYVEGADYTDWESFLLETLEGDKGKVGYLQKMVGLALEGNTTLERMHIVFGQPRSGKSTFLETVAAMFGDYAAASNPETLALAKRNAAGASGDLARLAGVRFVIMPEAPKNMLMDVALLKRLTGGDVITARQLYKESFQFKPLFSLWMNANSKPIINDMTAFTGDRICLISFNRRLEVVERDTGLKERFKNPDFLATVLSWAVDGLKHARADGASVPIPDSCKSDTEEYAAESDKIGSFIESCLEKNDDSATSGKDAYDRYVDWCKADGICSLSKGNFFSDLRERGLMVPQKRIGNITIKNAIPGYRLLYSSEI